MGYQAIIVDEHDKKPSTSAFQRKEKSLPNGESSSLMIGVEASQGQASPTWSSLSGDEYRVSVPTEILHQAHNIHEGQSSPSSLSLNQEQYQVPAPTESPHQEEFQHDVSDEHSLDYSLGLIRRRLVERRGTVRQGASRSSSICIFRFPHSLGGINRETYEPELLSIGPYHRGRDHLLEFEEHKWFFLDKFLYRTGNDLLFYLGMLRHMEQFARGCYSENVLMSSHDFVEMMLLDCCFLLELLRHLNHSAEMIDEDDPIFSRPWLIPILIRDLLKLENQIPYSVLHQLFRLSGSNADLKPNPDPLPILALRAFDLAFPRPIEVLNQFGFWTGNHLLDLFHLSLLPTNKVINCFDSERYRPSEQSIQCVTQLRPSGIKFKPRKSDSFLDINFRKKVLEIPSITINDFTSTLLVNCVALEQCEEKRSKYFTDYVSFMSCLVNQRRDVTFLCSDGIITAFSHDDQYVADLFTRLGRNIAFNIRDCSLSKIFGEVESYYSSNWATMKRTYFSSPWSFISVLSASILLVLTMIQSVMAVLSYKCY